MLTVLAKQVEPSPFLYQSSFLPPCRIKRTKTPETFSALWQGDREKPFNTSNFQVYQVIQNNITNCKASADFNIHFSSNVIIK